MLCIRCHGHALTDSAVFAMISRVNMVTFGLSFLLSFSVDNSRVALYTLNHKFYEGYSWSSCGDGQWRCHCSCWHWYGRTCCSEVCCSSCCRCWHSQVHHAKALVWCFQTSWSLDLRKQWEQFANFFPIKPCSVWSFMKYLLEHPQRSAIEGIMAPHNTVPWRLHA